jgi:predicted ArsR family transcriptional regulator
MMVKTKKKTTVTDVRDHIEKHEHTPFMVSEIAKKMETSFDKMKAHLLHLTALGFLEMKKIGRHWIFWKKTKMEKES